MASNPYVNKVQKADGSVIIDISDTTAVDSDVASGKYFYTASGEKKVGTGANDFIITVSYNSTTEMWEPDCTFAEYQTAYNAGKTIVLKIGGTTTVTGVGRGLATSSTLRYGVLHSSSGTSIAYSYRFNSSGLTELARETYIQPSGTLSINQNGTGIDVAAYASVDVAVPLPPDGNNMSFGYTDVTLPYVGIAKVGQAVI